MDTTINSNSNNSNTSELFICFTSRLSSSSMKLSSKSILSPGRAREPSQISLSSSLSRRLRSNGSIKGSPMFPTTHGKKRGSAFENPEPSSPKVTCIGQVRVKTKKQGNKIRARSKRRGGGGGGDVSFRKVDHQQTTTISGNVEGGSGGGGGGGYQEGLSHRNQRWVHLPMTICEAIREFNCFLPCSKSSCMTSDREKEEKGSGGGGGGGSNDDNGSSCGGAVFARWLVAVQDGEEEEKENTSRSQRRHVFEGIDIGELLVDEDGNKEVTTNYEIVEHGVVEGEEEERRVSVCVPPKNALLLMRCRSDPVKMAALANRFWECPVPEIEDDDDQEIGDDGCHNVEDNHQEHANEQESPRIDELDTLEEEVVVVVSSDDCSHEEEDQENQESHDEDQENQETMHGNQEDEEEIFGDSIASLFSTPPHEEEEEEEEEEEKEEEIEAVIALEEEVVVEEAKETTTTTTTTNEAKVLPDCLLLMMCEPKLSMEVSKETWVCSTDFIKWLPERPPQPPLQQPPPPPPTQQQRLVVNKMDGPDQPKKRYTIEANNPKTHSSSLQLLPPRSSVSFPLAPRPPPPMAAAASSIATMIEQKLMGSSSNAAYEPFALTRCKSEPMRNAAKLAPEACFWNNRKLEPHRPATFGVGAAGVGF